MTAPYKYKLELYGNNASPVPRKENGYRVYSEIHAVEMY
jgi:hypothetical protein